MKHLLLISAAALGFLLAGAAGRASAQPYPYYYQRPSSPYPTTPALSPYLDLRRGGNRATNYFLGTLPELDRRANAINFSNAILGLDRRLATPIEEGLPTPLAQTGHPAYFATYGSYYNFGLPGAQASPVQPVPPAAPTAPRRPR